MEKRAASTQKLSQRFIGCFCDRVWPAIDPQRYLLRIQLDITNGCNLSCVHCYHPHHKNNGALTYEQWLLVLDQYEDLLEKLRMYPAVTLCGGEPLVCPFVLLLIHEIRSRFGDCELNVLSNGTRMTPSMAQDFKRYDIHVQVSFDGPDAERNDSIRGKGSFEKALLGCRILKECGAPFHHLAVLSRRTAPWVPAFFKLPMLTGAVAMNFVRLVVEGSAKVLSDTGQDGPLFGYELKEAMESILCHSRLSEVPTSTRGELWHLIEEGLGSPNIIGVTGIVVDYRGEFKVSSRTSLTLGHVLTEGLEKLFLRHPTMQRLRKGDIAGCKSCKYFDRCRGDRNSSYATFGHFFGPDPGCWLLADGLKKASVEMAR